MKNFIGKQLKYIKIKERKTVLISEQTDFNR